MADDDKESGISETSPLLESDRWKETSTCSEKSSKTVSWKDIEESFASTQPERVAVPKKRWLILCILMVELCERMAFYGIMSNLVLSCTSILQIDINQATTIALAFSGTTYFLPILGGFVADAWATKFTVIFASCLIYLLGLIFVLFSSLNFEDVFNADEDLTLEGRRALYFIGLVAVAVGSGGVKANAGPFGAQQVQDQGVEAVQVFFNWFYWFVNAGGLFAFCVVAYVQQNVNFAWGLFIPVISIICSIIFLNIGWGNYVHRIGQESELITTFKICGQACCRKSTRVNGKKKFFDSARKEHGGEFESSKVDGVVSVVRLLPIFLCLIVFWAVYSQMQTTYYAQGMLMDLSVGSLTLPVAMLNAFNTIAVMVLVPVLDRVVYPFFKRIGHPLTYLQRMSIGFVLAASSVFVGGCVEIARKDHLGFNQTLNGIPYEASHLSVFVQAPQFFLVGAGEAFASIAGYEFSYTQAPKTMQGFLMGAYLATSGLGAFLSGGVLNLIMAASGGGSDSWFPPNINDGKVEYVLFTFGILMAIVCFIFLFISSKYKYQDFIIDTQCFDQSISHPKPRSKSLVGADYDSEDDVEPVHPLRKFPKYLKKYRKRSI